MSSMSVRGLLLLIGVAAASLAPTKSAPFTPAQASAHACPAACQASLLAGIKVDRETFSPSPIRDQSFYETAKNFSSSKPGDVLKFQPITNLANYDHTQMMPPGVTIYALQYTSVGLNDTKVPVTGVIALPFTINDSAESGQRFPLISYAHGTSGYLPPCAITHSPNFYDYYTWAVLTLAGYAVVGTDYAGLGNNYTRHVYTAPTIQSNDVFYAAIAAQKALPNLLTTNWAAAGHSQGGGAVYALTENKLIKGRTDFLGSVALSPAARLYDIAIEAASGTKANNGTSTTIAKRGSTSGTFTYLSFLVWAAQVADPAAHILTDLSKTYVKRYHFANELKLCLAGIAGLFGDLGLGQIFSSTGISGFLKFVQKYQNDYGAGLGAKAYAPLLIVQSTGDQTVPYQAVEKAYHASCKAGNPVKQVLIPYLDHSATPAATGAIWVQWLRDRFANPKQTMANCSTTKPAPVDKAAAFAPLDF